MSEEYKLHLQIKRLETGDCLATSDDFPRSGGSGEDRSRSGGNCSGRGEKADRVLSGTWRPPAKRLASHKQGGR